MYIYKRNNTMNKYREKDLQGRQDFMNSEWYKNNISREQGTEGIYEVVDMLCTGKTGTKYLVEIKSYNNPEHPRPYSKFIVDGVDKGYQIDESKLLNLTLISQISGMTPLLYVKFEDYEVIWQPNPEITMLRSKDIWTNNKGVDYGQSKSNSKQTYLYLNEALWKKEIKK